MLLLAMASTARGQGLDPCALGGCFPNIERLTNGKLFSASDACGTLAPETLCQVTQPSTAAAADADPTGLATACARCDATQPTQAHPASELSDQLPDGSSNLQTSWRSSLATAEATLMVDLGADYELSYVLLNFQTPPARQVVVEVFDAAAGDWRPLQYFADDCPAAFGLPAQQQPDNGTHAFCTQRAVDYSQLQGDIMALDVLVAGPRGDARDISDDAVLAFITARRLRVRLLALNPLGGLDPAAFPAQLGAGNTSFNYYALTHAEVGGRCRCSGHATECTAAGVCVNCQHNTAGDHCDTCLPLFNDLPFARGLPGIQNPCQGLFRGSGGAGGISEGAGFWRTRIQTHMYRSQN